MRILIIEDDITLAHGVRQVLADAGHQPAIADTLARGLNMVADLDPHVVILDLGLPDSAGFETMAAVHAVVDDRVPVVIFTGADIHADSCLEIGAVDYLVKGKFTAMDLPGAVERAVARHKAMRALRRSKRQFSDEEVSGPMRKVPTEPRRVTEHLVSVAEAVKSYAS